MRQTQTIIKLWTQCAADNFRTRCKYSVKCTDIFLKIKIKGHVLYITIYQNWIPSKRGKCITSFNCKSTAETLRFHRATYNWCLLQTHIAYSKTHRNIFWMCKQVSWYYPPGLIAVIESFGLAALQSTPSLLLSTGVHRHKRCTERAHMSTSSESDVLDDWDSSWDSPHTNL